jgi:hypothetical protein
MCRSRLFMKIALGPPDHDKYWVNVSWPGCTGIQQSPNPAGEDRSFGPKGLHLVSISVHLLGLGISWGRLPFIGVVFQVMVLRLLLLLSRRVLGIWSCG